MKKKSCSSSNMFCQCDNSHKWALPLHNSSKLNCDVFFKRETCFFFTLFYDFYKSCCRGSKALVEVVSPAICGLQRCWLLTCSHSRSSVASCLWYGNRHQANHLLHHLQCIFPVSFQRTCVTLKASSCLCWFSSVCYPAMCRPLGFRLGWWGLGDVTHCLLRPFPVWQHSLPSTASIKTPPCPTLPLLIMLYYR